MTGPSPQDTQPDTRSRLDRLTNDTLRQVSVCIAGALVTTGVVVAATHTGSEQHTWWGWLLIGAPLAWLSFIAMVALTFGALRIIIAALRSPLGRSAARHTITNTVKFLRAGYPQGVPTTDTFTLLAALPEQPSDDQPVSNQETARGNTAGAKRRDRRDICDAAPITSHDNPFGCKQKELPMNWTTPCTESRIGTATAAAALIAISGLIAPAHALATPTPTNLAFQTDNNKIGTSLDGSLSARTPLLVRGGDDRDRDRDRDRDYYYDDSYPYPDGQGYY